MMKIDEACQVIASASDDTLMVATMGAMNAFDKLNAPQPRINSVPLMGGAPGLGLGIALGAPSRKVMVVDGDASLLMQLGNLATVADPQPTNLYHFLIRNGAQFSGFSNLVIPAERSVDFAAMAAAAGYRATYRFQEHAAFAAAFDGILADDGPIFIELEVEPPPAVPGLSVQIELPDRQFQRMGHEARAIAAWLKADAYD